MFKLANWPACRRLLPHVLAATEHTERLRVAGQRAGWLLERAARYMQGRGQYREARSLAERALAVTELTLGPDDWEVGYRREALGLVLWSLGDYQGAREHYERALAIAKVTEGNEAFSVGVRQGALGNVLRDLGDLPGDRAEYERALEIVQTTVGPDHPAMTTVRDNLDGVLQLGDE
jgi:tetratricopeptide (TPR) repeat protein